MFVHWGPVTLKGTELSWSRGKEVPVAEYDNLYKQFNPEKFDAREWVGLAKEAGMKYIVFTSKHHDGFCMWDTRTTSHSIMSTPFKRDVIRELSDECKRQGITFCTYYSILDWYHPDYNLSTQGGPGYNLPQGQTPDINRYIAYMNAQLRELITGYGPLGVMWFDGEWEEPWTHKDGLELYRYVRGLQPDIIINNRVDKGRKGMDGTTLTDKFYAGDFDTPEQRVGAFQTRRLWETCITLGTQWSWKPDDTIKSLKECIALLVNTAGGDGNLLLNVGPMADGRIEPRQAQRLREIGGWMDKYGQSIRGTRGGPFKPQSWGVSTHRGNIIYVHILNQPEDNLTLPAIRQKIIAARYLDGGDAPFTQTDKGIEIQLPQADPNAIDIIIALELDKPAKGG
jgi:alpha-L-fucosidase